MSRPLAHPTLSRLKEGVSAPRARGPKGAASKPHASGPKEVDTGPRAGGSKDKDAASESRGSRPKDTAAASGPVIVSASRRTDIPALYGEWLRRRLDAGWCEVRHPFTGRLRRVSLAPADVLGWVFWSRNYAPFLDVLDRLHARGDRFLCHLTVTGLPRQFEPRGPAAEAALAGGLAVAERFGPRVLQWRYDPVLLSDATPPEWHLENFARIASRLSGATQRCIFSFPTMYARARRNLSGLHVWRMGPAQADGHTGEGVGPAAGESPATATWGTSPVPATRESPVAGGQFTREDLVGAGSPVAGGQFTREDLARLAAQLAALAREQRIALHVCCGEEWADEAAGIGTARCVDWPQLKSLGFHEVGHTLAPERANDLPVLGGPTFVVPALAGSPLLPGNPSGAVGADSPAPDGPTFVVPASAGNPLLPGNPSGAVGADSPVSDGPTFVVPALAGNPSHLSGEESRTVGLFPAKTGTTNVRSPDVGAPLCPSPKLPARPMRPGCGCYASVDIGRYETCSHGCAYCYAVQTPARAQANRAAHDPDAPAL